MAGLVFPLPWGVNQTETQLTIFATGMNTS